MLFGVLLAYLLVSAFSFGMDFRLAAGFVRSTLTLINMINRSLPLPLGYYGRLDATLFLVMKFLIFNTFLSEPFSQLGKNLILNNFVFSDSPFLFVRSVGSGEVGVFGTGFYVVDFNSQFVCASCYTILAESVLEAEALALIAALGSIFASDIPIKTIFLASADLHNAIKDGSSHHAWRINPLFISISDYILGLGQTSIHLIPIDWLAAASCLALLGLNSHDMTLFFQDRDLPYWLMKQFTRFGVGL